MIDKILFPTDFSSNADNALPFALDLALKNKAKLILIHVYDVPVMPRANIFSTREKTMKNAELNMRAVADQKMKKAINEFNLNSVELDYILKNGNAQQEIENVVTNQNINLIVMGTQGETAARELFVGSVTKGLIQDAPCPVLAIPGDCSFGEISRIAYATDLKDDETKAVKYLVKVAELYSATLIILHLDHDRESELKHIEALKEIVSKTDYPRISYKEIIVDEVSQGIEDYVKNNEIDMLAMITSTTSIFDKILHKSLTKQMLFHTHIPLLAFSRKKEEIIFL